MKITADFTRLHKGEEGKIIRAVLSEKYKGKKARLCFLTPMGKTYFTDYLTVSDGVGEFTITPGLTDGKGILLCQLFLSDSTGNYLIKSPVYRWHVYASVDDTDENTPDKELKMIAQGLKEGEKTDADYTGLHTASLG